ncbi:MAG: segregation and condensation protein A [Methanosaeta sp. PtaB.Bin039]|nr:MAG: segregation and condensation protein A [Methanosaeta sp. PtaB.Bin039]HOT06176.1 ScpA family protein [Methanotrichaceae archaeon]HQF15515.1 ScpA family protein [Methanotrichaceae archaeon]HQI90250.1 ScpA family protein [Methanotrichaceae archaeon]HQJ27781.1 ScpA family protein [Methanotrichaceae archaeon]
MTDERLNRIESDLAGLDQSDPAEVLVELARRGEVDPWDIDIVITTDRFLAYIDTLERQDLRVPARTLLYAAILLRMKSDSLEEKEAGPEEPEPEPIMEEEPDERAYALPRPPVRRRTKRPVTLDELITELKKAEMVGRRRLVRKSWPEPEDEIVDLSHEEGVEERIQSLIPMIEELLEGRERVGLEEVEGDLVMNYVSLLFMAHRHRVWLDQEEIFGDLFITRPNGKGEEDR